MGGVATVAAGAGGASAALEARDVETVLGLDLEAFGADRSPVVAWAPAHGRPRWLRCATDEDGVAGYCLGREGDRAVHIGPVVARSAMTACALVASAASSVPGKELMLDASTSPSAWTRGSARPGASRAAPVHAHVPGGHGAARPARAHVRGLRPGARMSAARATRVRARRGPL